MMAHLPPGLGLSTGVRLLAVFVTGLGLVVWASARSAPWRSMCTPSEPSKKDGPMNLSHTRSRLERTCVAILVAALTCLGFIV